MGTELSRLFMHVTSIAAARDDRHCWLRDPDGYRLSLYSAGSAR